MGEFIDKLLNDSRFSSGKLVIISDQTRKMSGYIKLDNETMFKCTGKSSKEIFLELERLSKELISK